MSTFTGQRTSITRTDTGKCGIYVHDITSEQLLNAVGTRPKLNHSAILSGGFKRLSLLSCSAENERSVIITISPCLQ